MVPQAVLDVLAEQDGVVARRQAIARGMTGDAIRRVLRRRVWAVVHPGVYADHTGPLTWNQRAWAAVLHAGRSALCGPSALRAAEGPGRRGVDQDLIHVAVGRHRKVVAPEGVRVHRMVDLQDRVLWNLGPPRLRYEEAAIDVALGLDDRLEALGVLAAACQSRRTTARRLAGAVGGRSRVSDRDWLRGVLQDVADGTCSVLEHGYATRVERPHGLPRPERQVRDVTSTGVVYRDVEHGEVAVELDRRLFHDTTLQRDRDFERDLDLALDGRASVRLSYGQVYSRACRTAGKVGALLSQHGWTGEVSPCGPDCPAPEVRRRASAR